MSFSWSCDGFAGRRLCPSRWTVWEDFRTPRSRRGAAACPAEPGLRLSGVTNEPSRVGVERATDLAGGSILHDRLTPLDASFLHLEDESAPLHVAAMLIFEGPAPAYEDFVEHVESRLHLVPRYRQRLALVPLDQGRPVWVDDDRFDVRFHVRATALPRPRTRRRFASWAAACFRSP